MTHLQLGNKHVPHHSSAGVGRPRWRSLLPAVAVSLLVHAVLLLLLHLPEVRQASRTALIVTLRAAAVEPPVASPAPPVASPAPLPPEAPPPAPLPPRVAAAPPEPVPAPAAPARAPDAATPDTSPRSDREVAQGPLPTGDPEMGELAPQLRGRRLRVGVWVDASGTVTKAVVVPNELTPEQVEGLERAIRQVRFVPARDQDNVAVEAVLRTLLCIDGEGQLDASSDECWKPQPAQAR